MHLRCHVVRLIVPLAASQVHKSKHTAARALGALSALAAPPREAEFANSVGARRYRVALRDLNLPEVQCLVEQLKQLTRLCRLQHHLVPANQTDFSCRREQSAKGNERGWEGERAGCGGGARTAEVEGGGAQRETEGDEDQDEQEREGKGQAEGEAGEEGKQQEAGQERKGQSE